MPEGYSREKMEEALDAEAQAEHKFDSELKAQREIEAAGAEYGKIGEKMADLALTFREINRFMKGLILGEKTSK